MVLVRAASKQTISRSRLILTCLNIDAILVSLFETSNLQCYSAFRTGFSSPWAGVQTRAGEAAAEADPCEPGKYRGHQTVVRHHQNPSMRGELFDLHRKELTSYRDVVISPVPSKFALKMTEKNFIQQPTRPSRPPDLSIYTYQTRNA